MKKLFFLIACLAVMTAHAQNSGLGFNYQAVVRNSEGITLTDTLVYLRVSLYPGQHASAPTWVETHSTRTDFTGAFGITVGKGERDANSIVGAYSDVNFAAIYYWMKIEILEGNTYRDVSFTNLPSCPYCEAVFSPSPFPAGTIIAFGGDVIPTGWRLCDGSEVSRTEFASLFQVLGVNYGNGDGSTTFNLPDTRGMFLRGVSGDSGNDPDAALRVNEHGGNVGNNLGSIQGDAIRNITGAVHNNIQGHKGWGAQTEGAMTWIDEHGDASWEDSTPGYSGISFDASRVVPVGGDNRPKNVYVNYIIKY